MTRLIFHRIVIIEEWRLTHPRAPFRTERLICTPRIRLFGHVIATARKPQL